MAQKTQQKIQNLLSEGSLASSTLLVLVNAIYFKGDWKFPFKSRSTCKQMFYKNDIESKLVDMMSQEGEFLFTDNQALEVKVIQLPYKNSSLSTRITLPNNFDGLAKLETSLNFEKFRALILDNRRYKKVDVKLSLPKFKLELSFPLKSCLIKLGMVDLFDTCLSDLSGMSEESDLFVSDAVHKAFISVDEKGTEAAAATAMIMWMSYTFKKKVEVFRADHPFIFCICDENIKSILFMGKVTDVS